VGVSLPEARRQFTPSEVAAMQRHAAGVFVHDAVADYAVRIVVATRDPARAGVQDLAGLLECGASPRATLGLVAGARALALLRGREYVLPSDVRDLAVDVIAHRLVLTLDALVDGVEAREVVAAIVARTPEPRVAPAQGDAPTAAKVA
jgi:MoxR-like ATPase